MVYCEQGTRCLSLLAIAAEVLPLVPARILQDEFQIRLELGLCEGRFLVDFYILF